jgi:ubiquinone/menaquinone biosynthesis C-methylase UbiE
MTAAAGCGTIRAAMAYDPSRISPDDPTAGLLAFLDHQEQAPDVAARRRRSCERLALCAGARVADVGCGAGTAARELAALVLPGGEAAGVDINPPLIEAARARATAAGVPVTFHAANALSLPFADASLDGYRAERLYQHLPDPAAALAEARRVLAPGGRIVLVDQDWDTLVVDSDDLATTRSIVRGFGGGIVNAAVGRRYHRLLAEAGFTDVVVEADAHASRSYDDHGFYVELMAISTEATGAVARAVVQPWLEDQRERGRQGRFFLAITHFIASARRG